MRKNSPTQLFQAQAEWIRGPFAYTHLYRVIIAIALAAYYFYWDERSAEVNYNSALYLKFSLALIIFASD